MTYNIDTWPYVQRCRLPVAPIAGAQHCEMHKAYIDHAEKYAAIALHHPSCPCDFCAEAHEAYADLPKLNNQPYMPRRQL